MGYNVAMSSGRIIAITDIHGELGKLNSLLTKLNPMSNDTIVFLGDYIDRGPNSKGVIDKVLSMRNVCNCVYLKGSHEYAYLQARGGDDYYDYLFWNYGGVQTVESYGSFDKIYEEHGAFLESLQPYYLTDNYLFIHAGIRPDIPFEQQNETDFYYIRGEFIYKKHALPQKIIFGHTDFKEPQVQSDKICIDTGCGKYPNALLTAIVLPDEKFITSD